MHPQKKAKLVYSSKDLDRSTVLSSPHTPSLDKLWRVRFQDDSCYKRLIINRWGYHYKPSEEYIKYVVKFKKKKP